MSGLYEKLIRPLLFRLDPETAHEIGVKMLRAWLGSEFTRRFAAKRFACESFGVTERFGLRFENPLGVAAGFDKNGVVVNQLASLGFGFVEVGTVTFRPQPGNDRPRLFRLPKDEALINRLGFNNDGAEIIAKRLSSLQRRCLVGINIGKNKDVPNEEAVKNYLASFDLMQPVADYIAVNISSPNTPNLREMQKIENLEKLLGALQKRNIEIGAKPLLVKIAPDLSAAEIEGIVDTCQRLDIAGIIAANTTISRDGLITSNADSYGPGGLSGRPLAERSTRVISAIHKYSGGKLPIIGVGGIFTAEDAFEKIAAGACLLQSYTGFVYRGPSFAAEIIEGLHSIMRKKGFSDLNDVVGSGA